MMRVAGGFAKHLFRSLTGGAAVVALTAAAPGGWKEAQDPETLPGDVGWTTFNGRLDGVRYSALNDIKSDNIGALDEACRVRVSLPGAFSAGPVVVDGVMYITALNTTIALNPTNCDIKWKSIYVPTAKEYLSGNRGVAIADGIAVRGTSDGHLVGYDTASGRELWVTRAGDSSVAEFITSAPIIWKGLVFVGLAGGDWGIRGRMMAYELKTGKQVWNFNLIPGPGEYGNNTWAGDSWRLGGGGTWTSYTLDPETGELFVPVANPAPDFNGLVREGANLFSSSIVVLDAQSGKYLWHYQTEAHDTRDRGVTAAPVLHTLPDGRRVVSAATKAGFLYTIDRQTHRLLYKVPTTTILNENSVPTEQGIRLCPGIFGGTEWNGPGYDEQLKTLVVGSVDWCGTITRAPAVYQSGELYFGGAAKQEEQSSGWITSFDGKTGAKRWQFHAIAPVVSGITPTAGGVTFVGDLAGNLYAFRSSDGFLLRTIPTGGAIAGGIITYRALGTQYLAVTSGNISRATWPKASGVPSIVIYRLNAKLNQSQRSEGQLSVVSQIAMGRRVFASICSGCHGASLEGANAPSLRGVANKYDAASLQEYIKHPKPPMPTLYPSSVSEQDVENLAHFLLQQGTGH